MQKQPQHHHSSPDSSQRQSKLLARLPTEIRLLIWQYAIGNQRIHIVSKYRRVGHTVCDSEYWREWNAERPGLRASSWVYTFGSLPTTKKLANYNLCDLLVTCQQTYAEACPLLYTTNTFAFWDLRSIAVFKSSVLPIRWGAICSVEIYAMCYRRDDMNDAVEAKSQLQLGGWPDACEALASMPNLGKLRILIGNARCLDAIYPLGGRKMELYEVVLRFLEGCKVKGGLKVVVASSSAQGKHEQERWNLLGLNQEAIGKLEVRLREEGVDCQICCNLQETLHANSEQY